MRIVICENLNDVSDKQVRCIVMGLSLVVWLFFFGGFAVFAFMLFKLWVWYDTRIMKRVAEHIGADVLDVKDFRASGNKKEITVDDPRTVAKILEKERARKIYVVHAEFIPRYVLETDNHYIHVTAGILKASLNIMRGTISFEEE